MLISIRAPEKPLTFAHPPPHPSDRVAYCTSPPPMSTAASSVGPSASQYQPSSVAQSHYQAAIENDRQRDNLQKNVFDIDDLSSVSLLSDNVAWPLTSQARVRMARTRYSPTSEYSALKS